MKRFLLIATLLLIGCFLTATVADAQVGEPSVSLERVNASNFPQVEMVVTPFDAFGLPIPNLFPDQFSITEDGQPVENYQISLPAQEEQAISVMLVLDISGSLRDSLGELRQSALMLYDVLELTDESGIIAFSVGANGGISTDLTSFDPTREANFTNDEGLLINLLNAIAIEQNAGTPLYDALVKGVQLTEQQAQNSRRAVILFTDGRDQNENGSGLGSSTYQDPEQVLSIIGQSRVPVFTIGLGNEVDSAFLQRVADTTGGSYTPVANVAEMGNLFTNSVNRLRPTYKLTYSSQLEMDGAAHTVEVMVQSKAGTAVSSTTINTPPPILPEPPAISSVDIVPPDANGIIRVTPNINAGGNIAAVRYYVNPSTAEAEPTPAQTLTEPPYTFDWDTSTLSFEQEHLLRIEVEDTDGQVGSITQSISIPAPAASEPTAAPEVVEETAVVEPEASTDILAQLEALLPFDPLLLLIGVGVLLLLVVIIIFLVSRRRQSPQPDTTPTPYPAYQPPPPSNFPPPVQPGSGNETALQTTPFSAGDPNQTVYDPPSGSLDRGSLATIEEPIYNPPSGPAVSNPTLYDPPPEATPPSQAAKTVQLSPPDRPNSPKTEILTFGEQQRPLAFFVDSNSGREYQLFGGGRIGRDPKNDIVLNEPSVSRFHAEIEIQGDQVLVRNLSQSNPILINGKAAAQAVLQDGDRLEFGRLRLIYKRKN